MEEEKNNVNTGAKEQEPVGTETKVDYAEMMKTNKEFQSFVDSQKTQAMKTAVENAKAQWKLELDTEKSEAEKLAKMNKEQKLEYEAQKERREKEDALARLNAYELKDKAIEIAKEKGVDISLLSYFDYSTIKAEELNGKIDEISTAFNKAVEKAVNERLKEDTPITKTGFEKAEVTKMSRTSF